MTAIPSKLSTEQPQEKDLLLLVNSTELEDMSPHVNPNQTNVNASGLSLKKIVMLGIGIGGAFGALMGLYSSFLEETSLNVALVIASSINVVAGLIFGGYFGVMQSDKIMIDSGKKSSIIIYKVAIATTILTTISGLAITTISHAIGSFIVSQI